MKKSRIAKFALLGASAAALAATLSTSTYAWYVSNKTANVTGGQAATGSAGSDGSILLSWTGNEGKWFKSISLTDSDKVGTLNALQPVHFDNGFYGLAVSAGATVKGDTSTDYVTFTVKIKSLQGSGKQTVVTPTLKFTNFGANSTYSGAATAPATQLAMSGTGAPVSAGQSFYVDALDSMYVQQVITGGSTSYSPANAQSCSVTATVPAAVASGAGDAHSYYTAVTGNTVSWGSTTNWTSGGLADITIIESTVYTITYNIFLDGADTDCFNSAVGQNFAFELTFSAADPTTYTGA